MWEARVRFQVFRKEFHTHIHLDWTRVEFLSCKKKKKKKKKRKKGRPSNKLIEMNIMANMKNQNQTQVASHTYTLKFS